MTYEYTLKDTAGVIQKIELVLVEELFHMLASDLANRCRRRNLKKVSIAGGAIHLRMIGEPYADPRQLRLNLETPTKEPVP